MRDRGLTIRYKQRQRVALTVLRMRRASLIPSPETTSLETIRENICTLKLTCADDCKTSVLCHTNLHHFCKTRDFQERQQHRH
jgi:hypothetical protein